MVAPPFGGIGNDIDIKHTFSRNSWHARLNRYIYGWDYIERVDCLCPYFWGTILALFALPLWLLCRSISFCLDRIPKNKIKLPKINISRRTKDKISKIIGYGFLGFVATITTYGIGNLLVIHGVIQVLIWAGMIAGILGLVLLVMFLIITVKHRYDDWRSDHPKSHRPNIVIQYIKAKKDKHCPRVIWKN